MQQKRYETLSRAAFWFSMALVMYMPLHIFLSQSASLVTGGLEVWKAAKDVLLVAAVPLLLWIAYKRQIFERGFRWHFILGTAYILLHLLFVLFDRNDYTYSAIVASVYNSRLLAYLLLGLVVGSFISGKRYLKWLLTAAVLVASFTALFGVLQYFLPSDLLTHVGYSLERGVKPLFFIDDKPDLPRVMSTLRDPNSFGAYLILPILLTTYAAVKQQANETFFIRPFRKGTLLVMSLLQGAALFLTFSRGAALGAILAAVTLLCIVRGKAVFSLVGKYWEIFVLLIVIVVTLGLSFKDSYLVQNVIFHADESTVLADPNELRVQLLQRSVDSILDNPLGYGPGTAGLVAITNPQSGILTENYYLQIAHEVGWLGLLLFMAILYLIGKKLFSDSLGGSDIAAVLFASFVAYLFYSLLIHLWSNEAVALQWWLLAGVYLSITARKQGM